MNETIAQKVDNISSKILHYLITMMGKTADEASDDELYYAFVLALREEIMINWAATEHTFEKLKPRRIYYLSMEYMPGRLFGNNITNMSIVDLVKLILKKLNRDFKHIVSLEPDIGIGNGGLGRLASCLMDSLATQKYPAMGYGMRYQYGIFEQEIWCGVQIERPDCWLLRENPWEFRKDDFAVSVKYKGTMAGKKNRHGDEVHSITNSEEVRALPFDIPIVGYSSDPHFSVLTLRLWSTKESPRNFQLQHFNAGMLDEASENTSLTDVLYPNDNNEMGKRFRLKQEFLLVSASIQDIIRQYLSVFKDFNSFSDKVRIQINDTHPALAIAELMRILTKRYELPWSEAFEITRTSLSYTNHTILKEALEEWNEHRLNYLLPRQFAVIQRLNYEFLQDVRKKYPGDEERVRRMSIIENSQVRMANLSIYGSHKVNGVAKLHTELLKKWIFKDFYDMYPQRFLAVTNGVTQRRWLLHCNPLLSEFITQRIGDGWITNFSEIKKLHEFADDEKSQNAFLNIKKKNKQSLLDHLSELHIKKYGETEDIEFLDTEALFDIQIKRVHEYKRQFMNALHALMLYLELKDHPDARKIKRFIIIGGKAAPGYLIAKNIIRFIYCLSRTINQHPEVSKVLKIYFFPNYNVSNGEILIPAADLSEQISTAGMEASGTGNMKLTINGALTVGTEDGANIEMHAEVTDSWWPFSFGASADSIQKMLNARSYNPWNIYHSRPDIKRAMDALIDGSLTENEAEEEALKTLHHAIMEGPHGGHPDRYFTLYDLPAYYEIQKKVEELYQDKKNWARYAIHNIASMGKFSTDESIKNYAEKIWGASPCPTLKKELAHIREEFAQYDRCRILPVR